MSSSVSTSALSTNFKEAVLYLINVVKEKEFLYLHFFLPESSVRSFSTLTSHLSTLFVGQAYIKLKKIKSFVLEFKT